MRRACLSLALCLALLTGGLQAQSTRDVRSHAKMRFTTMIVLPEYEEVLDFACGDKDFWVISGAQNLAYIKPAKAGATTNLNLVAAAGDIYSFVLAEGAADPDLKLYVSPDESFAAPTAPRRFYGASQVEELRLAVRDAQEEAEAARFAATQSMDAAKAAADQATADVARQVACFAPPRCGMCRGRIPIGLFRVSPSCSRNSRAASMFPDRHRTRCGAARSRV